MVEAGESAADRTANVASWLYDGLRTGLREGKYPDDHAFSEIALMQSHNATRATVRGALNRLAAEGLLTRSPKRGTTPVARTVHVTHDDRTRLHTSEAEHSPSKVEHPQFTVVVRADSYLAETLEVGLGDRVRIDESLIFDDEVPLGWRVLYTSDGLIPPGAVPRRGQGAEPWLTELGFPIERVDTTFEAISCDLTMATRLRAEPGMPLLHRIHTYFSNGRPLAINAFTMRGDRVVVHTTRGGSWSASPSTRSAATRPAPTPRS
jgi:GntR family transcriptional regulator